MNPGPFWAALPLRAACLAGIWTCYRIALADRLGRQGGEEPLRAAIAARPNHYLPYWQLAQLGTPDARDLLAKAIRLNPYNAGPIIDLAHGLEAAGEWEQAERWLLEANRVDKTYFPRWSLANFYLRRGLDEEFWRWARGAAEAGCEDMTALFDLARRMEPDVARLAGRTVPDRGHALHNFLDYLAKRGLPAPAEVCERAARFPDPNLAHRLAIAVEGQLAARRFDDARRSWSAMVAAGLAREPGEVPAVQTGMAFDWRLPSHEGVSSSAAIEGLEIHLSGRQPDIAVLCERLLLLDPSSEYRISHRTRLEGLAGAGIRWKVILEDGGQFHTADLASGAGEPLVFRTSASGRLARLVLAAERPLGATRAKGTLTVESVRIDRR